METAKEVTANKAESGSGSSRLPAVSLPKGGGAIRGIGEKFAANPVTGTGSMTRADLHQPGALRASGRSFRSPTTRARATGRSASAGASHFPRSPARPTKACPGIGTPRSPTSSSSPAPRISCRFSSRTAMNGARGPPPRTVDGRELSRPPLPAADRGPVRADRALDQLADRPTSLALDLEGQRHDLVRQDDREPRSPTRPTTRASSAG